MRFDDRFLEEIKSRVRLSDVIGKTVKLKRQGREYAGLSPFTKEKTPSFFVNDDKGFWHDFSSGKHGDLIGFLQEVERLSFPEAVERIANEAGVPLPAADPQAQEREQKRLGLQEQLQQQELEQLREQVLVRVLLFYRKRPEQQQRSERPERRSSSFQIS